MTKHIREMVSASGIENVSRRGVLKGILATGSFVLAVHVMPSGPALADDAPKWGADGMPHGTVNNPLAFVSIAPDGTVTIVCHRSEMGQGVRTGMPLIVADEMEADWARVKVAQATGDEAKYGNQDTDGSRSTRHFFMPMRQVGAAARMMLEAAAAKRWGVDVSDVEAKNHEVIQKSTGKKLGYGELAADASTMGVPSNVSLEKTGAATPVSLPLKDPSEFRYIGKEGTNIVDGFNITTGRAIYGQDVRLPGQKYAVIARPAVMGGKVASYDATDAKKVPGVVQIVEIPTPSYPMKFQPSGGIAVIADNTWAAIQGRNALKINWDDGPHATYDSQAYRAEMEATARQPGKILRSDGDFAAAYASADKKVEAEYYIPHNAHATMEPPSATCRIVDGKAEVWTSVQSPQAAHDLVAAYLGASARERHRQRDPFGRRFRPQVEAGLRGRGGFVLEGDGRRAGQGRVDSRGRHPQRLLPHGVGRTPRGRARQGRQGRRMATQQRRADDLVALRGRSQARSAARAGHGPRRHALRHQEREHREWRGRSAHQDRLVALRLERSARVRHSILRRRTRACGGQGSEGRSCSI